MKIKTDFVTNSSSVSFIVWGVSYDMGIIIELIGDKVYNYFINESEKNKEIISKEEFFKNSDMFRDYLMSFIEQANLENSFEQYDYDYINIGRSPFKMKPCQTLINFKEEIQKDFENLGLKVTIDQIQSIIDCWYDG